MTLLENAIARLLAMENIAQKDLGYCAIFFRYALRAALSISLSSVQSWKVTNSMIKPVRSQLSSRYRDAKTIEQEDAQDATSSESPVFIAISEAARVFVDPVFDSLG